MTNLEMISIEEKVNKLLNENNLYGEVYCDAELPVVNVEIDGDWKHVHLRLKNLMSEHGFSHIGEKVIEDTESDDYEAVHSFIVV